MTDLAVIDTEETKTQAENSQPSFQDKRFSDWKTRYTFDNCKLNRGEYGKFLLDLLSQKKESFVLNLNGQWGSGKTEFLRRLYSEAKEREHPAIYINAWESDFSQNPLHVITSEFITQIESFDELHESTLDETKSVTAHYLKTGIKTALALAVQSLGVSAGDALTIMDQFKSPPSTDSQFKIDLLEQYKEQLQAIEDIKNLLTDISDNLEKEDFKLPVMVMVDELDRCRPDYAIKLLEVIKHFFEVKNFVFVVATDTKQLSHSIKSVYGSEFDAETYLKRFFQQTARLPEPDLSNYIKTKNLRKYAPYDYDTKNINLYPNPQIIFGEDSDNSYCVWLTRLVEAYDLSIRDMNQLLAQLENCLAVADAKHQHQKQKLESDGLGKVIKLTSINFLALAIGIIEYQKSFKCFDERSNFNRKYQPTTNNLLVSEKYNIHIDQVIQLVMMIVTLNKNSEELTYLSKEQLSRMMVIKTQSEDEKINYNLMVDILTDPIKNPKYDPNQIEIPIFLWEDIKKLITLSSNLQ